MISCKLTRHFSKRMVMSRSVPVPSPPTRRPAAHRRLPQLALVLLVLVFPMLALSPPAHPPTLTGRWAVRQIIFVARRSLPDSLQERLLESPVAGLNAAIRRGELTQVVEFQPDSTYVYVITRAGQVLGTERGRYQLRQRTFETRSNAADSSLLDHQRVTKLSRHRLLLETPIWRPALQVWEQVQYERLRGGTAR